MCGIAGFADFTRKTDEAVLKKMTSSLAHRGPDGDGLLLKEEEPAVVGLGHRRLSIIDLSAVASQPMTYKHFHIVFNGEIYNYAEIRSELIEKGHQFITHSDTEVILHAFEEWGNDGVHRFIGMFAFVIYDETQKRITAFRDRSGVKPFYYYWHEGLFLFSSELKAFHEHPGFQKELDLNAVASFLQHGNVPTPHCIFKNSYKLRPGHYLELSLDNKQLKTVQYWNIYDCYNKPKLKIDLPEALEETERILKKAFEYRMVADVPVGVFLSGGYDSACVTALLQTGRTDKIRTFTIGMPDEKLDESPYAKQVAKYLGTEHTEYRCTDKEARDIIPSLPYYYDEPFADSSAIPTMLVSRLARKSVTVALSADAGDELFAGYTRYSFYLEFRNNLTRIPRPIAKAGHYMMKAFPVHAIPGLKNNFSFVNRYDRFAGILKDPSLKTMFAYSVQMFTKRELSNIMLEKVLPLETDYRSDELKEEFFDPLTYMMAVDYETYMLDDILQKVDRATMSTSLEGREPFLDHHIADWAAVLPVNLKYNNGDKKHIIKQLVHKYIPKEMMERPKMGFAIPIREWMENGFKDMVCTYLDDSFLDKQGIFNKKEVRSLLKGFYEEKKVPPEKLWYLFMFQLWYSRWMVK